MPYIGNTVNNQGFTPAIDYFNGDGVTVTFTLSRPVVSVAQMIVAIDNVIQNPSSAFTVSGNSITFTSAPLAGTNNIWVEYTSLITTYNAISQDPSVIGDITATGGFLAVGDFGNTYTDGTIVDYVTGNARITTGPADGLTIYNGGTASRTALTTWTAAGNVGIGTSSPNRKLEVTGGVGADTAMIRSSISTDTTYYREFGRNNSSGSFEIRRAQGGAATTDFVIDTSGNVGIGTASPSGKLHVNGQTYIQGSVSGGLANSTLIGNASGQAQFWGLGADTSTTGSMTFVVARSNLTNSNQALTIDSSGNVGIGTASPTEKVTSSNGFLSTGAVSTTARDGAIVDYSGNIARFIAGRAGGNYGQWEAHVAGASGVTKRYQIDYDGTTYWYGANGTTERMRITSGGSLLIGQTADNAKVCITFTGGASQNGLRLNTADAGTSTAVQFVYNAVNQVGTITTTTAATAYNTTSDYRLKENIAPMTGALEKIAQLKPVTYKWKSDGSDGQGFIAHELAEIVPDCVTGEKDAVDAEGNPVYQGIDTSFLVATLTAAIQEQQAIIEDLKARIETLEAK